VVYLGAAVARGVAGRADVAGVEEQGQEVFRVGIIGDPALSEHGERARVHHLQVRDQSSRRSSVMGAVLVFRGHLRVANLLVDLAYLVIDPRIRRAR
jgi:hypothetical protein